MLPLLHINLAEIKTGEPIVWRYFERGLDWLNRLVVLAGLVEEQPLEGAAIFRAILATGEPFDFAALEARLNDSDRTLLARLTFADEIENEEFSLSQAQACLSRMEASGRDSRLTQLKVRIREAERDGRLDDAMALMKELNESKRSSA